MSTEEVYVSAACQHKAPTRALLHAPVPVPVALRSSNCECISVTSVQSHDWCCVCAVVWELLVPCIPFMQELYSVVSVRLFD
jgi:hypothetical protein